MKIAFLILTLCFVFLFYFLISKGYSKKKLLAANLMGIPIVGVAYLIMRLVVLSSYSRTDAHVIEIECVQMFSLSLLVTKIANATLLTLCIVIENIGISEEKMKPYRLNKKANLLRIGTSS